MLRKILIGMLMIWVMVGVNAAWADVPSKMSYEGRLTDNAGNPITVATSINFKIYDAVSGGSEIWSGETHNITPDSNGVFSVILGNTTAITSADFSAANRYLQITVAGEALSPRTQIVSVGYAFKAADAQAIAGQSATDLDNKYVEVAGDTMTGNLQVPRLEVDAANTYLDRDGGNNMTLTDSVTGTRTLAQLAAGTGGTVTSITQGTGITATPNPITNTGTIAINVGAVPQLGTANTFAGANSFTAAGTAISVTNNASIGGTLTNTGAINADGGVTTTAGNLSLSSAGGTISTTNNLSQTGASTFSTGTGAVSLNGNATVTGANTLTVASGTLNSGTASTNTGTLVLYNSTNSNTTTLQSGVATGTLTFTLPTNVGTPGQVLQTNNGVLSWVDAGTGDFLADGTVAMTGNLNMGNNLINNLGVAGASLTRAGAHSLILTTTNPTNVTFPTTGTLATLVGGETLANKTLTTPTIGDFTNATHSHSNAAGGGQISHANLTALDYASSGHTGFEPTLTKGNLTGTADQVTVTGGTGAVIGAGTSLSLPQNIATTSTPQFLRIGLNQAADISASMAASGQYYSAKHNNAASGSVDWNNANVQYIALPTGNTIITFSNPRDGARYLLILYQNGGSGTVTWPGTVKWPGGTPPLLTPTNGKVDIVTFVYDGTNYYGGCSLDY